MVAKDQEDIITCNLNLNIRLSNDTHLLTKNPQGGEQSGEPKDPFLQLEGGDDSSHDESTLPAS